MRDLFLVGIGGFFGSVARYLVSKLNINYSFHQIPVGTLTVNLLGSLVTGLVLGYILHSQVQNNSLRLLLVVGFCGGFTTFSAFANENFLLLQSGQLFTALLYIFGSIALGVLFVYFGYLISNLI